MLPSIRLTKEAQKAARDLYDAWVSNVIERRLTFVDVTAGNANNIQITPGFGVLQPDTFIVPSLADLEELDRAGLIVLRERAEGKGRKWDVQLLQSLKDEVESGFGTQHSTVTLDDVSDARVFISYSRKDIILRRILEDQLKESVESIWSDQQLGGGDEWWQLILRKISECTVFVYLLSPDSIASLYCRAEFSEALRLQKKVLPVKVRPGTQVPNTINRIQVDDLELDKTLKEMVSRLQASIGRLHNRFTADAAPLWSRTTPLPRAEFQLNVDAGLDPETQVNQLNTGLYVIPGDKVRFRAEGKISIDEGKTWLFADGRVDDPSGRPFVYPNEDAYRTKANDGKEMNSIGLVGSLIGWIGDKKYSSEAFLVGTELSYQVPDGKEGFLFLAVNDARGTYTDNKGAFRVFVTVDRNEN